MNQTENFIEIFPVDNLLQDGLKFCLIYMPEIMLYNASIMFNA